MFSSLKHRILEDTVRFMFKLEVRQESEVKSERPMEETKTNRDEGDEAANQQPVRRTAEKIGRNDPCWCGSGKKWKKCHYPQEE
ncbi:MAG: SEC-C domain-containing protein [Candidatus Eremiobacteraeota bacterium]|nr:SEC-C domain-containing protein [Candidatus Eremiobacteraeota bacterium]